MLAVGHLHMAAWLRLGWCLQEREAAKVTHSMDGFVHKAFSISHATSFDEVRPNPKP